MHARHSATIPLHTRPPRGVLLDIDGTLLDSNDAHARAWSDALEEHDVVIAAAPLRRLIGEGGDKILPQVARIEGNSPRGEAIADRSRVIFRERYLAGCAPFPGARDLVARMKDEGLVITVATSATDDELGALLRVAGVHDLIEHATTSSDAARSKPDPDIVSAAAKKAGLPSELLVMLGDTPYDVQAAASAGIRAVAVRSGGWGDVELAGAVAVYADVAALLRDYESSPFGRARPDASARTRRAAARRG